MEGASHGMSPAVEAVEFEHCFQNQSNVACRLAGFVGAFALGVDAESFLPQATNMRVRIPIPSYPAIACRASVADDCANPVRVDTSPEEAAPMRGPYIG